MVVGGVDVHHFHVTKRHAGVDKHREPEAAGAEAERDVLTHIPSAHLRLLKPDPRIGVFGSDLLEHRPVDEEAGGAGSVDLDELILRPPV